MEAKCYPVQGLDCPNCAAKVERAMEKLSETGQVNLDFAAEKLYLTPAEGCSHAQALEAAGAVPKRWSRRCRFWTRSPKTVPLPVPLPPKQKRKARKSPFSSGLVQQWF